MLRRIALIMLAGTFVASAAAAQETKPAAAPKQETKPAAKTAPEPPPLPVNIKIEVSITDQTGNNPAAKKVVTMIASDRQVANVRSSASVPVRNPRMGGVPETFNYRNVTINVDARPTVLAKESNRISVNFGLEYLPKTGSSQEEMEPGMTSWSERLSLILESGKPMIISQAADPTSDRKITVEVTATILK
jgi:glucose/arabinose dehydrogenase